MASPRVFLLPKDTSSSSPNFTIISLPHPRTLAPTRYLLHPETGLHEITKITPPTSAPRSWLLTRPEPPSSEEEDAKKETEKNAEPKTSDWLGNGQTIQDAHLYVSTPVDPLFLVLPRLLPAPTSVDPPKTHFLPLDDMLEAFTATDDVEDTTDRSHWEAALKTGSLARRQIETRIKAVCDTVDVGGEMAYKPNQQKVLELLARKCEDMAKGGLPKSMEDAFVVKPLARPITEVSQQEEEEGGEEESKATTILVVGTQNGEKEEEDAAKNLPTPPDSQQTTSGLPAASEDIKHLLRLRVASQFLSGTYLPTHIPTPLTTHLSTIHDFTPLDTYLSELKRLKIEAASLRSGDFTLKRGHDEDGGDAGAKKRRKEEEEEAEKKKKKGVSKGVRDLGKVNTRGMAKLTSFFKKKNT